MTHRDHVYDAIDSERDYQNAKWGENGSHNPHSVTEWLTYMRHYIDEGLRVATLTNEPETDQAALPFARKVAALGVVCMEQHGAPRR